MLIKIQNINFVYSFFNSILIEHIQVMAKIINFTENKKNIKNI